MARMVLEEMERGEIPVLIGRAPECYGPGTTQSFSNALVTDRLSDVYVPALQKIDPERLDRIMRTLRYAWRTLMRDWVRDLISIDDINREVDDMVHLLLDPLDDGA